LYSSASEDLGAAAGAAIGAAAGGGRVLRQVLPLGPLLVVPEEQSLVKL
jgi:hypothetical protein